MAQTWREFHLLYRWLQLLPATEVSRGPTISWRGCSCLDLKGILQTLKPGHQLLGRPVWTNCQLLESDLGCSHPWSVVPATGASGVFYSQLWGWTGIFSQNSYGGGPVWVRQVRALHHQLEQGHGLQSVCLLPAAQGTECLYHPQTCCVCLFNSKL